MVVVVIKNYIVRNRRFVIAKDEEGYMAIEDKYITDGKLNTPLRRYQVFAEDDLNECLKRVTRSVELAHLEAEGHSRAEAFAIVFGMMDKLPELEKAFAGL